MSWLVCARVSNSLDEYTITSILGQGGKIDSFGVGERLISVWYRTRCC